jgi:large subunit ribosomal protein L23
MSRINPGVQKFDEGRLSQVLLAPIISEKVSTLVQKGKVKRFGRSTGRRDHVKKAYVSLKPGQELNFSGEAS